jgi:predicted DNA binding protein
MTRATPARENVRETFLNEFTAKQRTALKLSHKGGFFDWPRDSTGEEIAELMGVSAPTFH